jgi:hypothetical protein
MISSSSATPDWQGFDVIALNISKDAAHLNNTSNMISWVEEKTLYTS